jgi:polysaccharide deacetylase 2 family uncharacterized protein YibQ
MTTQKTSHLIVFVLVLLARTGAAEVATDTWRIAIIIDDLGYALEAGKRAVELPGPVSYAVLPFTPRGAALAEFAHEHGKEVLLHLPLESVSGQLVNEPGRLALDMTRRQFATTFAENLESVPHVTGINSHRGSLLTRHPGHMAWLMEEIRKQDGLYFVDSYTTHESVALKLAHEAGVPAVRRDVFLDPDPAPETLEREFARLKTLARQRGLALGIGHPYPATLAMLERALPGLAAEGYELVSISRYIDLQQNIRSVAQSAKTTE